MFEIQTSFSELNYKSWIDFVNNNPQSTVFQSIDVHELFDQTEKMKPVIIVASNKTNIYGTLIGVIIKEYSGKIGFFTSRTVVYGGPLIHPEIDNKEEVLDALLKGLIKAVKNKTIFIQFRNFFDWSEYKQTFTRNGFKYLDRLNFIVDTSNESIVKKRISKSKLRQIKKGHDSGAKIIEPESISQVKEFYALLHNLYKHKVKKPLPRWSFFENFYKQTKNGKLGMIRLIEYNNKIIGGILSPITIEKVIYEWYICGLDQEYKHCYPSVLATWAAIDYALKNNITYFDFMGVGVPDKDYGVREFKSKFGGDMVNYGRFGRINNKFLYTITEIGYNILSLLNKI